MKIQLLCLALLVSAMSCGGKTYAPPNDRKGPLISKNGMDEEKFHTLVDAVVSEYRGDIQKEGATVSVDYLWDVDEVNAGAGKSGSDWNLTFYGGLARSDEITFDAFTLVVCHEMGHLLGGEPYYKEEENTKTSNEGQSDYFSTLKCVKRVWKNLKSNFTQLSSDILLPNEVTTQCNTQFVTEGGRQICIRGLKGGQGLGDLLSSLEGSRRPSYLTPSRIQVSRTYDDHPPAQCRMDTLYSGMFELARPRCWYNPNSDPEDNDSGFPQIVSL